MSGWLPNLLQAAQPGEFSLGEGSSLYVQWGAVLGASLAAAVWDLRQRRIPNALTLPMLGAGLVYSAWVGGLSGAAGSLADGVERTLGQTATRRDRRGISS